MRRAAAGLALVSLLTAVGCGQAAEEGQDLVEEIVTGATQPPPEGEGSPAPPTDGGGGAAGDATPAPPPEEAEPRPGGTEETRTLPVTQTDDDGPVGVNGPAILRDVVPRLVLEIDAQEGVGPDAAALDHLLGTLQQYAQKPGGITRAGGNTFASDQERWTPQDIRAVADRHRSTSSGDGQVSIYLVYLRGELADSNAIGVAVNASEVGLFPQQWSGLGSLVGGGTEIEEAVLVHELGHLLGLVNLTYQSDFDHESEEHPGHSSNDESVMFWAVESDLVGQVFGGPPPDTFDRFDQADIEKIRQGG